MYVHGRGHWGGNPVVACDELTVRVKGLGPSEQLAVLFRLLIDEATREKLFEAVERIDAENHEPAHAAG